MVPGEYAVHSTNSNACTVFPSLEEAEACAREQTAAQPALRCRIYDHHGFIGKPLREVRGSTYKGEGELSARFRRWVGSGLFLGGILLIFIDWRADFSLSWPAMVGIRMVIPGLVLLVMEAMIIVHARRQSKHAVGSL
jgi:hypothetical protein